MNTEDLLLLIKQIPTENLKKMLVVIDNEVSLRENLIRNIKIECAREHILITGLGNITSRHSELICEMFERFGMCHVTYDKESVRVIFDDYRDQENVHDQITVDCIADIFKNY